MTTSVELTTAELDLLIEALNDRASRLREDIHRQSLLLKHIEVMLTVVYADLHDSTARLQPGR
jgi:hypothetical protein